MRGKGYIPLPIITGGEEFDELARKLERYFVRAVESPHNIDELQKVVYGRTLRPLVEYLVDEVHCESVVSALLAVRWQFSNREDEDDRGLHETRGLACELVAWRFVAHLTERQAIDYLCCDVPAVVNDSNTESQGGRNEENGEVVRPSALELDEQSPLLDGAETGDTSFYNDDNIDVAEPSSSPAGSLAAEFAHLNALEIAAVAGAKKFLGEKSIQRVINGIWKGDIVFWNTLSTHSVKKAQLYNRNRSDPFCRLRVPLYLKIAEVLFFLTLLAFYYAVLIPAQSEKFTAAEGGLYLWLLTFSYNELGEFWDAGLTFYATDFWSSWDLGIIATGLAAFISRAVGVFAENERATNTAFDILSVQALFLLPRVLSILSLHPYFGMLLPALKEMTKDFIRFLGLVAILYLGMQICNIHYNGSGPLPGFDTTFTFLARGTYSFGKMNWLLVKVFFGSGYLAVSESYFDCRKACPPLARPASNASVVDLTSQTKWVGRSGTSGGKSLPATDLAYPRTAADAGLCLIDEYTADHQPNQLAVGVSLKGNHVTRLWVSVTAHHENHWLTLFVHDLQVLDHARDEYLFVYAVFVLEASTSNRLTYFLPPLNLLPLIFRPLRLILTAEKLRSLRIILLKATHWPFVGLILGWENGRLYLNQRRNVNSSSRPLRGPPNGLRRPVAGGWRHGSSKARPPQLTLFPQTARRPMARPEPAATETIDDLQAAVAALKMQVEAISSLLEKTSPANNA